MSRVVPRAVTSVANVDHEDVIVLLAPEARQAFPRRPRHTVMLDWSIDDPSAVEGDEATVAAAYQRTFSFIEAQIRDLVSAIRDTKEGNDQRGAFPLPGGLARLLPREAPRRLCAVARRSPRPPSGCDVGHGSGSGDGTRPQRPR